MLPTNVATTFHILFQIKVLVLHIRYLGRYTRTHITGLLLDNPFGTFIRAWMAFWVYFAERRVSADYLKLGICLHARGINDIGRI
jgi:hypothetical protein